MVSYPDAVVELDWTTCEAARLKHGDVQLWLTMST